MEATRKPWAESFLLAVGVAVMGCGGGESEHFNAPEVAPLVRAATPAALRPKETASLLQTLKGILAALAPIRTTHAQSALDVNGAIEAVFKDDYPDSKGGQVQGLINQRVLEIDQRMAGVDARGSTSGCLGKTPIAHRINLSSVAPALDLTLTVQCTDNFEGGNGAGMVFGREEALDSIPDAGGTVGANYSMWLHPGFGDIQDQFALFANVLDAGTDDKSVDFMYLENSLTTGERIAAFRVKANPATEVFEFVFARNGGGGGWYDKLQCGFRMISDGNFIWVEGMESDIGASCDVATAFTRCLDADDFSDQSATTSCDKLATTFTMEAPTAADLADAGDSINTVMQIATASDETSAF